MGISLDSFRRNSVFLRNRASAARAFIVETCRFSFIGESLRQTQAEEGRIKEGGLLQEGTHRESKFQRLSDANGFGRTVQLFTIWQEKLVSHSVACTGVFRKYMQLSRLLGSEGQGLLRAFWI